MKRHKIDAGTGGHSDKLKWCRLYTFATVEDGRKMPQLSGEQKFETTDSGDTLAS